MKPPAMFALILAALAAGVAGGVYGAQWTQEPQARPGTAAEAPAPEDDAALAELDDLRAELRQLSQTVETLRGQLQATEQRALDAVTRRLDEGGRFAAPQPQHEALPPAAAAAASPVPGAPADLPPEFATDAFRRAVDGVVEAREEKKRAERREREAARWRRWRERQATTILKNLDKKLVLADDQKARVKEILQKRNAKYEEVSARGQQASERNESFNWRAEMRKVSAEATTAVRELLTPAQLQDFEEASGDRGLRAFDDDGGH